jgi:diphthine-ammonia ligase
LHRLHNKFELDVCGEGGEYESLVLDCSCFQKALEITRSEVVYDDEDPSVGSLKIVTCEVRDKPNVTSTANDILNPNVAEEANVLHVEDLQPRCPTMTTHHLVFDNEGFCQTPLLIPNSATATDASLQLQSLFQSLAHSLRRHDVDLKDVVFVHLYLSDMSLFSLVNAEYCKWFGVDPPSRSCVAVPLPPGIYVTMDALVLAGSYANIKVRRSGQLARREVIIG